MVVLEFKISVNLFIHVCQPRHNDVWTAIKRVTFFAHGELPRTRFKGSRATSNKVLNPLIL